MELLMTEIENRLELEIYLRKSTNRGKIELTGCRSLFYFHLFKFLREMSKHALPESKFVLFENFHAGIYY